MDKHLVRSGVGCRACAVIHKVKGMSGRGEKIRAGGHSLMMRTWDDYTA
jgi:hypothetical protein